MAFIWAFGGDFTTNDAEEASCQVIHYIALVGTKEWALLIISKLLNHPSTSSTPTSPSTLTTHIPMYLRSQVVPALDNDKHIVDAEAEE